MNADQIRGVAAAAGFAGVALDTAVAIALAESSGNPNAHLIVTQPAKGFQPEDSRGLWQINVIAHPQYKATNLFDPAINAAAAWEVSGRGRTFYPWTTYTSGAYLKFMPRNVYTPPAPATPEGGGSPGAFSFLPTFGMPVFSGPRIPATYYIVGGLAIALLLYLLLTKTRRSREAY